MAEIIARTSAKDYSIRIQSGLLDQAGSIIAAVVAGRRAMVVTDETIAEIYLGKVLRSLREAGFQTFSFSMGDGEDNKNMATLERIYHAMAVANMSRKDVIIALGGGVVGDITGFAAGTYLNGIKLIHIPTTLMSQVDSAIGGETFVNMTFGKNLVGTVYQPHAVLIDPLTLRSLPRERLTDGMAEVIKYGVTMDRQLFDRVEAKNIELEWIVDRCVRLKVGTLRPDNSPKAELQVLDFGHTLGVAIEQLTDYSVYYHGEAISIGMMLAARIGEALGFTPPSVVERLKLVLKSWHLPVEGPSFSAEAIMAAVRSHPRVTSERPTIILLTDIGESFVHPLSLAELEKAFSGIWN